MPLMELKKQKSNNVMDLRNFKATVIPRGLIVFSAIVIILLLLITFVKNLGSATVMSSRATAEWAYFQGQKEAINGDVRIKYNNSTGRYEWTKSCWDDGTKPIFDPSVSENRR